MNIALIGYRGTGKSAVSRWLTRQTGKQAVSLDDEIVQSAGKSISQIVENDGWAAFRDLEQEITAHFAAMDDLVIDCGGGVVLREANTAVLKSNATLVWLKAGPAVIEKRIASSTERPALKDGKSFLEEIEEVLLERTPLYESAADFSVDTENRSPKEIADLILAELKRR
ncbi:MAG: shikimate kinase [Deltaproteobacteria bacterium]|nr:shikimate kinase [Deltaproteobacteria bacterium]